MRGEKRVCERGVCGISNAPRFLQLQRSLQQWFASAWQLATPPNGPTAPATPAPSRSLQLPKGRLLNAVKVELGDAVGLVPGHLGVTHSARNTVSSCSTARCQSNLCHQPHSDQGDPSHHSLGCTHTLVSPSHQATALITAAPRCGATGRRSRRRQSRSRSGPSRTRCSLHGEQGASRCQRTACSTRGLRARPSARSRRQRVPRPGSVHTRTIAVDVHADRAGRVLVACQLVAKVLEVPKGGQE